MSKLNTKIVPLTYERYLMLTQKSPSDDKTTQCEQEQKVETEAECKTPTEEDVLLDIPLKQRGKRLLRHMKDNDMKWDSCGRLVIGSETVANTHICQLIKDLVTDDDSSILTQASRDFFKLLALSQFDFDYGESDK